MFVLHGKHIPVTIAWYKDSFTLLLLYKSTRYIAYTFPEYITSHSRCSENSNFHPYAFVYFFGGKSLFLIMYEMFNRKTSEKSASPFPLQYKPAGDN
jgi:hypothetical protein